MFWLYPRVGTNPNSTWLADEPLLTTPTATYTAANLTLALRAIGYPAQAAMAAAIAADPDLAEFAPPGVDTLVIYGSGIATPVAAEYGADLAPDTPAPPPTIRYASGDNIVPLRSSLRRLE